MNEGRLGGRSIDVSKATLDAYWLSGRQHQVFSNDQPGLRRLLHWLCKAKVALTVFEATGVYDRQLQAHLAAHGLPFARINPKQARRFAKGVGQLAKTDKVDAILLARMFSPFREHSGRRSTRVAAVRKLQLGVEHAFEKPGRADFDIPRRGF